MEGVGGNQIPFISVVKELSCEHRKKNSNAEGIDLHNLCWLLSIWNILKITAFARISSSLNMGLLAI